MWVDPVFPCEALPPSRRGQQTADPGGPPRLGAVGVEEFRSLDVVSVWGLDVGLLNFGGLGRVKLHLPKIA